MVGQTEVGVTGILLAHQCDFGSGELINKLSLILLLIFKIRNHLSFVIVTINLFKVLFLTN